MYTGGGLRSIVFSCRGAIDGKELVYKRELEPGEFVCAWLSGSSPRPSNFDFTVENRAAGMGVEESAGRPRAQPSRAGI